MLLWRWTHFRDASVSGTSSSLSHRNCMVEKTDDEPWWEDIFRVLRLFSKNGLEVPVDEHSRVSRKLTVGTVLSLHGLVRYLFPPRKSLLFAANAHKLYSDESSVVFHSRLQVQPVVSFAHVRVSCVCILYVYITFVCITCGGVHTGHTGLDRRTVFSGDRTPAVVSLPPVTTAPRPWFSHSPRNEAYRLHSPLNVYTCMRMWCVSKYLLCLCASIIR